MEYEHSGATEINATSKKINSDEACEHMSSNKWLSHHGLKKLKLDFSRILNSVGFKNSEEYIKILKKPVASKYGEGLFQKVPHKDGNVYNITVTKKSLVKIENKLQNSVELYKRRLDWLTSGSRKFFGVIEENRICFIMDFPDASDELFQRYVQCIITMFKEQLIFASKFNILRAAEDVRKWKDSCVGVSADSIIEAIDWLLDQSSHIIEYSITSVLQTLLEASVDKEIEAIYICTNGGLCRSTKQLIMEKVKALEIPVHVVYLGPSCSSSESLYLAELTKSSGGRLHVSPLTGRVSGSGDDHEEKFDPQRVGVQPDVMLIWEELDDARTILTDLQAVITSISVEKASPLPSGDVSDRSVKISGEGNLDDLYISSKDWLKKYGLKKVNLTLQSFLKSSTFDHSCGVLAIKQPRTSERRMQSDTTAVVDAKYCDKFGHIKCTDGTVKHVQFSEAMYREYNKKMEKTLKMYRERVDWLQNGSRELFGTIIEKKVCILIDTSSSMSLRFHVVEEKLLQLFQEQLLNKEMFNIINFGSRVRVWKTVLVTCNSQNLYDAANWVQTLETGGSTNTFTAIKTAYSMEGVEALYLLTDGRPDQPGEMILSQVSPSIPIHPISFNCADEEANQFLCALAARTGGRYHQFSDELVSETLESSPYASNDLSLIREEIVKGMEYMKCMSELRDECHSKQTSNELFQKTKKTFYKRPPSWNCQSTPYAGRHMNELGYLETKTSLLRANPFGNTNHVRGESSGNRCTDEMPNESKQDNIKKKRKKKTATGSEIKRWLKKNGLIAQQLTIFDALGPTVVEQKGKYVPLLGKEVTSKVYGEAFPSSRHSGKERTFKIVNPRSVNMDGYQEKLKEFLELVELKLDSFILGHLSDDTKEEYKHDDGSSFFSYLANKKEVVADLDERGLSTVIKQGKLLEKEIKQARLFLQQSRELEELVTKLKSDAKTAGKSENVTSKQTLAETRSSDVPRMRYHRVLARSDIDGFYYPAIVNKYVNPRYVNVVFDSGEKQMVSVRYIVPFGGSTACPTLNVGDYVLAKSSNHLDNALNVGNDQNVCYVPGIIQVTPLRMSSAGKYYTVVCYNGTKSAVLRKDLFKIMRSRFIFSARFIQEAESKKSAYNQRKSFTAILHRDRGKHRRHERGDTSTESRSGSRNSSKSADSGHSKDPEEMHKISVSEISDDDDDDVILEPEVISAGLTANTADDNGKLEGECYKVMTTYLDEWKEHFQTDCESKINEIKVQKSILLEVEERLKLNEERQQEQQALLEKQCQELQLAQKQFLEKQIQLQEDEQKYIQNEFKDLSEMQVEAYKRLQQQHDELIKNLLEKQEKHEEHQNTLLKGIDMKDEETLTEHIETFIEQIPEERKENYAGDHLASSSHSNHNQSPHNSSTEEPEIKMFVVPDSEAILMAHGGSGIYVSRTPLHEDPAVVVKKLPMKVNQEVLARFEDEGWYYRGTIYKVINECSYVVQDGVGDMEEVSAEDILFDEDDANNVIHVGDHVIGLHPKYQYAYAPGLVVGVEVDGALRVQFYDAQVAFVPRVEAYLISPLKFESDCAYIRKCEEALIGQAVVCRDNKTGVYHLSAVRDRVNGPRNYLIEWPNHALDIQNYAFIFGSHTKRQKLEKDSHVLAISNSDTYAYLPGRIIECNTDDSFKVAFCDGSVCEEVKGVQSFWLSSDYYSNAVKYWHDQNAK